MAKVIKGMKSKPVSMAVYDDGSVAVICKNGEIWAGTYTTGEYKCLLKYDSLWERFKRLIGVE